jgi:hypothetical protein
MLQNLTPWRRRLFVASWVLLALACCVLGIEHLGYRFISVRGNISREQIDEIWVLLCIEESCAAASVVLAFFGKGWLRLMILVTALLFFWANDGRSFA